MMNTSKASARSKFLPGIALIGGAAGYFLRGWELTSAFEPDTGLPIPNAPAFWVLVVFSLVMAAALLLLCRGLGPMEGGYDQLFAAKENKLYLGAMALSALLLLGAGVLLLLGLPDEYAQAQALAAIGGANPLLTLVPKLLLALLAVGSSLATLMLGMRNYRGMEKKGGLPLLIPGYLAAFWLISAYQARAGDPIRQAYLYELLAIIAVLMSSYRMASFFFEKGKPFPTVFFSLMSIYLSMVTLADPHRLAHKLLFGAFTFYLAASAQALLSNAGKPVPTEPKTEEPTDEG